MLFFFLWICGSCYYWDTCSVVILRPQSSKNRTKMRSDSWQIHDKNGKRRLHVWAKTDLDLSQHRWHVTEWLTSSLPAEEAAVCFLEAMWLQRRETRATSQGLREGHSEEERAGERPGFHDVGCVEDGWWEGEASESFQRAWVCVCVHACVCVSSLTRHRLTYCWIKPTANRVHKNTGSHTQTHTIHQISISARLSAYTSPRLLFSVLCSRCQRDR